MKATQWDRLQQLVQKTAELPPDARDAYLNELCGEDHGLRRQVAEMVAAYEQTESPFLDAIESLASRATSPLEIAVGERIGPYLIVGTIGHGGMGTVYRAQRSDDQFRQNVAIKVVRSGFGDSSELFARFRSERQILANINHPNIARLLDGGITPGGLPYLVMEYIDGTNLDVYAKEKQLSTEMRLELFRHLCAAVQHAHQNLIVHRDLKPANVIVAADGTPKLLDFGIAKLLTPELSGDTMVFTRPAERLMTPEYASPEQIRGETITTATDVYGLGVLLYELLTGSRPFRVAKLSSAEIERLICETQPRPPSTLVRDALSRATRTSKRKQTDLDRIVLKAMHKIATRRYASAADLSRDVQRYLEGFPVAARPDTVGYRTTRFIQRHTLTVSAVVLVFLTIVGLSINLALQEQRARHEAASAEAVSEYLVGLFNLTMPDATQGRSVSARDLLDHGTAELGKNWKGEPTVEARLLSTLGSVYYQLGALDQAAALFVRSKDIYVQQKGLDSAEVADLSNSLGEAELEVGDYDRSMEDYRSSVRIFEKIKPESSELADAMDGLSGVLWELGSFRESEQYHLKSIAMATRVLGPTAPMTLVDKNNYGVLLVDMGRYREAETLAREVLAARFKIFGETNAHTASSMFNLGVVLFKEGRLAEAKALFDQSLSLRHTLYGAEHHNIAKSLMYRGLYYRQVGDLSAARTDVEQAVRMTTRIKSDKSLDTALAQDSLGMVLLAQGDSHTAKVWVEKALHTRTAQKTPSQGLLSQSYDHLGLIDLAEGRISSGLTHIELALKMRESFYTPESDLIATSCNHLGRAQLLNGKPTEALAFYQDALRLAKHNFGERPHPITIEALYGIGIASMAKKSYPSAEAALDESMQMQKQLYPSGHPNLLLTAIALHNLEKPVTLATLNSILKDWIS